MKSFTSSIVATALLSALTFSSAQIQIGSVTLTHPGAPAPTMHQPGRPHMVPAPVMRSPAVPFRNTNTRPVPTVTGDNGSDSMNTIAVPAGAQEIRGRVLAAGGNVSLPAGSTVYVSVNDLTRPAQIVQISFKTSRLSTPYQLVFNSGRLNRAHTYAVRSSVVDANGKVLYSSDSSALLPSTRRAVVNVTVR